MRFQLIPLVVVLFCVGTWTRSYLTSQLLHQQQLTIATVPPELEVATALKPATTCRSSQLFRLRPAPWLHRYHIELLWKTTINSSLPTDLGIPNHQKRPSYRWHSWSGDAGNWDLHQLLIRFLKYSTARTIFKRCREVVKALKDVAVEISVDNTLYFEFRKFVVNHFDSLSHTTVSSWAVVVVDNMYVKW